MSAAPRPGWHYGATTWVREGDALVARPRAARRAAGERSKARHRYRERRPNAEPPPPEVYTVDRPGTLRRQARIPLWIVRTPEWWALTPSDRARLVSHLSHADGDGAASVPRDTTAREMGRLASTVTRADKRLRAAGWLRTQARRVNRHKRLPNLTRFTLPPRLAGLANEIQRRLAGQPPTPIPELRDDDIYVTADGARRVRSALVFGWEIEHPDVQAVFRSPTAGQVWLTLRSLLASGPRRITRLLIAELAGLVSPDDIEFAADRATERERARRCDEARKRVTEAVVSLEVLGLVRPEREPGAPSRYHLSVPSACAVFLPHLGELCPRAWGGTTMAPPAPVPTTAASMCPSCNRPASYDRAVPRDGWFDFCYDEAHAGQRPPRCPTCDAVSDGDAVIFEPGTGSVTCLHCDAHGRASSVVLPPRRPGGRVVGEPPIEDGPPPGQRQVPDDAAERVVKAYLDALPAVVRQRRRAPRPTAAELDAARVLVAHGGQEHAAWCARRLAVVAGAGFLFPADAANRVVATA